ncbi:hypothetical protein V1511DRAFT_512894 [Dipodascopsis uninucleata]
MDARDSLSSNAEVMVDIAESLSRARTTEVASIATDDKTLNSQANYTDLLTESNQQSLEHDEESRDDYNNKSIAKDDVEDDDDKSITITPLVVTLLLVSGLRISLTIDQKFMKKHSLEYIEPENLSVYSLKEAVFSDWTEDMGEKPTSTDFIRLIYFGKLLDDKDTLGNCQISRNNVYNVLHMSVRPISLEGHNNASHSHKRRSSSSNDRNRASNHPRESRYYRSNHRQNGEPTSGNDETVEQIRSPSCGCIVM